MATKIRKTEQSVQQLADAINDIKAWAVAQFRLAQADIAAIAADADVGTTPTLVSLGSHNDRSELTITAATAADLATSLTLVNEIKAVYNTHCADTLAHKAADTTNLVTSALATDLATAITMANEIKTDYAAHRVSTTFHVVADSTNTISAADATDLAELITLLNELKTDINAHMASGPAAKSIRAIDA